MTPEVFEEIGEDYDDGKHSCKTLAALPRSRQALVVTSVSSSSQGPFRRTSHVVACARHMCYLLFCERDEALNAPSCHWSQAYSTPTYSLR
jgi:hypothetical protein